MSHRSGPAPFPSSVLRLAVRVLLQERWSCSLFLSAAAIHAAAHGALAWLAGQLARSLAGVDLVLLGSGTSSPAFIASMGLAAAMIKGGAGIVAARSQTRLAATASESVRNATVCRLLDRGLSTPSPTALARTASRVREVAAAIQDGVFATGRAVAQLIPIAVALFVVSPRLTLVAALTLLPFAVLLSRARRAWRSRHERFLLASDQLHEEMDDLVRHADLWRSYGTGDRVRHTLERIGSRVIVAQSGAETLRTALSSANEVLGALALVLALAAGAHWSSQLADGSIIAFAAVFFMAYRPLRDLGDARTFLTRGDDALQALSSLSRLPPGGEAATHPVDAPPPAPLVVRDLSVPGLTPVVSFEVPAGAILALAGPTGAGKTTLLRALLGLEPMAQGIVRFGGRELRPGHVGPGERPFAWVPQDAPVVSGTLDDNLALAGTTLTEADRELEAIGASFLRSALAGVQLGDGGRALSGGERRWIAVARALATRLPVLLLDEPTVGLDAHARQRLLDTLSGLRGRRTLIVVSHEQDVLNLADEVISLRPASPSSSSG